MKDPYDYLKLRPVEIHPSHGHPGAFDVTDPSGIATGGMTLSGALMFIASLMDGTRRRGFEGAGRGRVGWADRSGVRRSFSLPSS